MERADREREPSTIGPLSRRGPAHAERDPWAVCGLAVASAPTSRRARGFATAFAVALALAFPLAMSAGLPGSLGATIAYATPADDLTAADEALRQGEMERALELWRRVAALPQTGAGAEALAALALQSPDAEEAVAAATAFMEHHKNHPQDTAVAEVLGHYRAARGDYRAAARHFAHAESRTQGRARARLLLLEGRALIGALDGPAARAVFERAALDGDEETRAAAALGVAQSHRLEGRMEPAAAAYRDYLARFPEAAGAPMALGQLADALRHLGQADEALDVQRRLVREHPQSLEATAARDALRRHASVRTERPAPAARGHYSLQVGAFGSERNAQTLARELGDLGLEDVRIEREERDDKLFFRVRFGSFRDPEEAAARGQALREQHNLPSHVVLR